ncbi:MAG: DUF5053 domain-containing protein [Prevotellaceae bacterium]|jgi:anaerobic ribonucleoside-triphosphate reductase|nr:DUF5053 domain-containing protein [Prevotellaceae bacterium]
MDEKFIQLRNEYIRASGKRKQEISEELQKMSDENPDAYAKAFENSLKDAINKADELLLKEKLKSITPAVSLSYIAKKYFGKTRHWLYQRINGSTVNGKPARFTEDELQQLKDAFHDLGKELSTLSF